MPKFRIKGQPEEVEPILEVSLGIGRDGDAVRLFVNGIEVVNITKDGLARAWMTYEDAKEIGLAIEQSRTLWQLRARGS